jgi:hypothetical protein
MLNLRCDHVQVNLPALGLDIVDVGVFSDTDVGNTPADVDTVFDYRVALAQRFDREFVSDRYVARRVELNLTILIHDPAREFIAGFDAFYDNHTDGVIFIVHYKVNHTIPREKPCVSRLGGTRAALILIKPVG